MKVMSLFAGIGGFDLAAEKMGWETVVQVEIDTWCQKVLAKNFPNAFRHGDIKTFDGTAYNGAIDLVCGGFPCQPYSNAGKQLGDQDERHLWPEMLRVIRQVAPRWIVGENVGGFLTWNGGLVFEQVQAELEAEGYKVQPFVLPACGVNAPHKRDRVWIVAHATDSNDRRYTSEQGGRQIQQSGIRPKSTVNSNTVGQRPQSRLRAQLSSLSASAGTSQGSQFIGVRPAEFFADWPTQPPICAGDDGFSDRSHRIEINENTMGRFEFLKLIADAGDRLSADFETGKLYSLVQRNAAGQPIELHGSDCNGYTVHTLFFNGIKKQVKAHQAIWVLANGIPSEGMIIDHINRDRKDNRLSNLRLVTPKGNRENSTPYKGRLNDEDRNRLVELYEQGNNTMRELAEDFGISKSRVHQLLKSSFGPGLDRNRTIKAAGNAVVWRVVYQIFKAIQQVEDQLAP